jgi:hypothetical protein
MRLLALTFDFSKVRKEIPWCLERHYNCEECGDFMVYHKDYTLTAACCWCGKKPKHIGDNLLIIK